MKEDDLSKLSLDVLEKQYKVLKQSTAVLCGLITVMVITCTYLTIKQGFSVFTVLPVVFFAMIPLNLKKLKSLKSEIASRQ